MDLDLVEKIVHEVKSQGVFDEFRRDSIADVDTKPAYQNLRQRVDSTVNTFLSSTRWTPETNKNQLREKLRRHIADSGFLDVGVKRIVDQVVNPKINSVFQSRIEEIAYKFLGLPLPIKTELPEHNQLMPAALAPLINVETSNLLPTDLEQVSPDSNASTIIWEFKDEVVDDDEEESPPFEPLVMSSSKENEVNTEQNMDLSSTPSPPPVPAPLPAEPEYRPLPPPPPPPIVIEPPPLPPPSPSPPPPPPPNPPVSVEVTEEKSGNDETNNISISITDNSLSKPDESKTEVENDFAESTAVKCEHKTMEIMAVISSHDSQLSQVSSDSHLSIDFAEHKVHSPNEAAVNISEEAQMPKFNENSSETNAVINVEVNTKELHFDINKDEIKFEGTERKISINDDDLNDSQQLQENKNTLPLITNSTLEMREVIPTQSQTVDSNFYSSLNDSSSAQLCIVEQTPPDEMSMSSEGSRPISAMPLLPQATSSPSPPPAQMVSKLPKEDAQSNCETSSQDQSVHKSLKSKKQDKDKEKERGRGRDRDRKYGKHKSHRSSSSTHSRRTHSDDEHNKSKRKDKEREKERSYNKEDKRKSGDRRAEHKHLSDKMASKKSSLERHRKSNGNSSNQFRDETKSKSKSSDSSKFSDDHYAAKEHSTRQKTPDSNDDNDDGNYWSMKNETNTINTENKSNNETNQTEQKQTQQTENDIDKTRQNSSVVVLNDLLENPNTNFIDLDERGKCSPCKRDKIVIETTTSEKVEIEVKETVAKESEAEAEEEEEENVQLVNFFAEDNAAFKGRLQILEKLMHICRSVKKSLRYDKEADMQTNDNEDDVDFDDDDDAEDDDEYKTNISDIDFNDNVERNNNKGTNKWQQESVTKKRRHLNDEWLSNTVILNEQKKSTELEEVVKRSRIEGEFAVSLTNLADFNMNAKENKFSLTNAECSEHNSLVSKKTLQNQRYTNDDLYKPRKSTRLRPRRL